MGALDGTALLLVDDDEDSVFLLAIGLRRHGAQVETALTFEDALESLTTRTPDVLVSDLQLGPRDGNELIRLARNRPGLERLPAIALTGHGRQSHRDEAFGAGYAKLLLKPASINDLVSAVLALVQAPKPVPETPSDVRDLLAQLSEASPCRFTSLLRFANDDTLASVWTFDRENPQVDPFPLGLPITASYCTLVRAARESYTIENAATDPRTTAHPKRDELASYVGVPVWASDGSMFGTLCTFDAQPLRLDESVRDAFERASRTIESLLITLADAPVAA
ncbi:MAG: response regulator [Kofleriaceae bacterium]